MKQADPLPIDADPRFKSLYQRSLEIGFGRRLMPFAHGLRAISANASAKGSLHGSAHCSQIQRAAAEEIDLRLKIAWAALARIHATLGSPLYVDLPSHLKNYLSDAASKALAEVTPAATKAITMERYRGAVRTALIEAQQESVNAHYLEVDIYVASLHTKASSAPKCVFRAKLNADFG
jgi:hypothetical protein